MHLCFSGLVGWSDCAPVFFWVSWLERIVHPVLQPTHPEKQDLYVCFVCFVGILSLLY